MGSVWYIEISIIAAVFGITDNGRHAFLAVSSSYISNVESIESSSCIFRSPIIEGFIEFQIT